MEDEVGTARGREAVTTALIAATKVLLAERGSSVALRDIEARSGINKGQIHHYFGGKQGLIDAAFLELATEHFESRQKVIAAGDPLELTLRDDRPYWQALVRLVIDGDLETVGLEFDHDISVPREVFRRVTKNYGLDEPDIDLKATFCALMALELGWAAFSPFIEMTVGISDPTEREAIVEQLRRRAAPPTATDRASAAGKTGGTHDTGDTL